MQKEKLNVISVNIIIFGCININKINWKKREARILISYELKNK